MIEQVTIAKNLISKKTVDLKKNLTLVEMKQVVDGLRGAMMIAYPGYNSLGDWDPSYLILENKFDWTGAEYDVGDVFYLYFSGMRLKIATFGGPEKNLSEENN